MTGRILILALLGLWLEARNEAGWRNISFATGATYTLEDKIDNSEGKEGDYDTDDAIKDGATKMLASPTAERSATAIRVLCFMITSFGSEALF